MPAHRVRIVVGVTLLAACATPQIGRSGGGVVAAPAAPAEVASEPCLLSTGDVTTHPRTITIGLTEPVDPRHAPLARNDAERIVFRHLYETPVRVDCQGNVLPELTEKWVRDDDGRRWTFRLRDGAHYWDGAPVTAQDVVYGKGGVGYTLGALDPRVVTVALAKPRDDVPAVLGDATLAVAKAAPDSSWPIGTGHYWATSGTTTPQEIRAHSEHGDTLVFRLAAPAPPAPRAPRAPPASGDARDLLDAGVDLLVTRDRALRDYAATLPNLAIVALPWDRTYVFVTAEASGSRFDGLEQAVRAEARRAEGGFWWLDLRACGVASGQGISPPLLPPVTATPRRILYARSDPTARELAGRLAALTHAATAARAPDDLSAAVAGGKEWGYVVALPRITTDPCRAAKDLLPSWAATITALVDTRATAIARRGVARWTVDLDGTAHLAPSP
ncbi:MAG TPA: ABC transporter substrate-binding protein [Gemmatimonadales bacterium]|nr:ABC transporter substrate-binding protein [Gemmatimonadales bacterium]